MSATQAAAPQPSANPASPTVPGSANHRADDAINWKVISILLIAAFVVILNETILSVAITHLMGDFQVDARTAQWLSTGFMLTMSVVIPTTGFLMDRLTTRQMFMTAMGLFTAGTTLATAAPSFSVLLLARVVQASGTAMMMPLLMTTILNLVPMHRRGQTMGLVSVVMSVAPAMGPTVSGIILHFGSWRLLFGAVLPIAVIALIVGWRLLTNVSELHPSPLDPLSVVLAALGFGGLVYALSLVGAGQNRNLAISLTVAIVALVAFVTRQLRLQKSGRALLDLRTFTHHNYRVALAIMCVAFLALMGIALIWPIYLLDVRHVDSIEVGLMMLPGGLAMGLLGPVVGRLYDRLGPRPLVVPAGVVATAVIGGMGMVDGSTPIALLVGLHVMLSLSLAFIFTPCFTAAPNSLPRELYPHGSAGLGTLQQVAGAAGAALLVTVMAYRASALTGRGESAIAAQLGGVHMAFHVAAALMVLTVALGLLLRADPVDERGEQTH